jgi:hypothetical protein
VSTDITSYDEMTGFETDLLARRANQPLSGGNPNRFIELVGGSDILYQHYEPDPNTTRGKYYYNTRLNILFKRLEVNNASSDTSESIWKQVSEY